MVGRPPIVTYDHAREIVEFYTRKRAEGASGEEITAMLASKLGISHSAARMRLWKSRQIAKSPQPTVRPVVFEGVEEAADPIEVRRHKLKAEEAAKALKKLEERLVVAEDIRSELMGLGPVKFSKIEPHVGKGTGGRIVILHISDIQYGEYIDFEAMDGVNSYGLDIANDRIKRYFQKSHRFVTDLWQNDPPEKIVILLNGDMISGALHHELDRTDEARPMMASKLVSEQLIAGITLLADEGFLIEIISTPGNHGRTTIKPESKDHALQNYDTLVAMFIETAFKNAENVSVRYSKSVDALFNVFSFPMLVTHGDRMGSRGGAGFMGATATILRGHHKLMADYAARGIHLYKIFTGHFHTPAVTVHGYANNTMAGASEYSRDGRMNVTPPSQDYLVVHEEHGVIEHRVILVGDPEEGSSCAPFLKYAA